MESAADMILHFTYSVFYSACWAKIPLVIIMTESNIKISKERVKQLFDADNNIDFNLREFKINFKDKTLDAFLIYYDGMSSQTYLNRDIMRSLMTCREYSLSCAPADEIIERQILSVAPVSLTDSLEYIGERVSYGECAIFVDGCSRAFIADIKGWDSRGVDSPTQEVSLSGPQEAFNESIMTNLALVRKILKDPRVTATNIPVGRTSKTPCVVLYINGITNTKIVDEVKRRLGGIDTDYIYSSSDIEMLIEDSTYFPLTRTLKTERPDRVASMLADGKVAVIVQGSPFAIILPTTSSDLIEATEDNYVRVPEANLMRFIRIFGMALSVLLPASFLTVMLYHPEILPTDLLVTIAASRENVPFSLGLELLLVEISFELIKEASVRVPNPIGSTLGIIGGLILGSAAVEAGVVSPLLIIIVSVGGIGAFATPTLSLSRSLSVMKFIYIAAAYFLGMLGLVATVMITLASLASTKTFGVPFLTNPFSGSRTDNSVYVRPIWKKEKRPHDLLPKIPRKQPKISRKWKVDNDQGE